MAQLCERLLRHNNRDGDQPRREQLQRTFANRRAVAVQQTVIHANGPAFDVACGVGRGQRSFLRRESGDVHQDEEYEYAFHFLIS